MKVRIIISFSYHGYDNFKVRKVLDPPNRNCALFQHFGIFKAPIRSKSRFQELVNTICCEIYFLKVRIIISFSYHGYDNFKVRKVLDPPES